MPTPTKPAKILKMEKKSHRTKKELKVREAAEASLLTGIKLKESKENKENEVAHKEFLRISKLLKSIGKDDDLYSGVINRYCITFAECIEFEKKREYIYGLMQQLEERSGEMDFAEYIKTEKDLSKTLISFDKQIQTKRKMLFDIEKENIMTIASSLRTIPKKDEKKNNPLREALNG